MLTTALKVQKVQSVKDGHALSIGTYLQSILLEPEPNSYDVTGMASHLKSDCASLRSAQPTQQAGSAALPERASTCARTVKWRG